MYIGPQCHWNIRNQTSIKRITLDSFEIGQFVSSREFVSGQIAGNQKQMENKKAASEENVQEHKKREKTENPELWIIHFLYVKLSICISVFHVFIFAFIFVERHRGEELGIWGKVRSRMLSMLGLYEPLLKQQTCSGCPHPHKFLSKGNDGHTS